MVSEEHIRQFESDGVFIVKNVLNSNEVEVLRTELVAAIDEDKINYPDVFDKGMIHNCMFRGKSMATLMDHPVMNEYLKRVFSPTCIIYAYQSSSLPPNSGNYGSRVHVDCPRFILDYVTNIGIIFPLDDFTEENGGTYYLSGSHKNETLPDEQYFYENALRVCCNAGDMIFFNARLVHAAGTNTTAKTRHSLTINLCRSYMRQRFDFCRMADESFVSKLGEDGKRLLGWNVRMPTSLQEFYLPESERLYKPGQG